jgi:hypothetical protein
MAHLKEQNVCIKFCFKLGKTSREIFKMLTVSFAEQKIGRTQVFGLFSKPDSSVPPQ